MRVRGTCHVLFAYDVGYAVDLDRAASLIREASDRKAFRKPRRAPPVGGSRPRPLLFSRAAPPIDLGPIATGPFVATVLYDFGGASLSYTIPVEGELEDLVLLSDLLFDNEALLADSRQRVGEMLMVVEEAVNHPALFAIAEDYVIFCLEPPRDGRTTAIVDEQPGVLARVLRAEPEELSEGEVREAVSQRLSYGPRDLAVVDWFASVLVGEETDDERAILEFANVELLEWRVLDRLLDRAVDTAWEIVTKETTGLRSFAARSDRLRRIARMQADYAYFFEGVANATKLVGDQYLARLFRIASTRLHVMEWEAAIDRKLRVLDTIHSNLTAYASTRWMEILEWVIIILIAVEIVIALA